MQVDGKLILTGSLPLSKLATSGYSPTAPGDLTTKSYVDALAQGFILKNSVRVATRMNLAATYSAGPKTLTATANGAIVVDTIALSLNDRVLVKNQTTGAHNGLYVVTQVGDGSSPFILTRSSDYDNSGASSQVVSGAFVFVQEGEAGDGNGGSSWAVSTPNPITLGTTAINWVQVSSATEYTIGDGLELSGSTLSAKLRAATTTAQAYGQLGLTTDGLFIDKSRFFEGLPQVSYDPTAVTKQLTNTSNVDVVWEPQGLLRVNLTGGFYRNGPVLLLNTTTATTYTIPAGGTLAYDLTTSLSSGFTRQAGPGGPWRTNEYYLPGTVLTELLAGPTLGRLVVVLQPHKSGVSISDDLTAGNLAEVTVGGGGGSSLLPTDPELNARQPVRLLASTNLAATYNGTNLTLTATSNGALSVDGVAVAINDRLLLVGQTDPTQNGIYVGTDIGTVGTPFVLTRAADFDDSENIEIRAGITVAVLAGADYAGSVWVLTGAQENLAVDVDDLIFTPVLRGSNGLTLNGVTLELGGVLTDDTTLDTDGAWQLNLVDTASGIGFYVDGSVPEAGLTASATGNRLRAVAGALQFEPGDEGPFGSISDDSAGYTNESYAQVGWVNTQLADYIPLAGNTTGTPVTGDIYLDANTRRLVYQTGTRNSGLEIAGGNSNFALGEVTPVSGSADVLSGTYTWRFGQTWGNTLGGSYDYILGRLNNTTVSSSMQYSMLFGNFAQAATSSVGSMVGSVLQGRNLSILDANSVQYSHVILDRGATAGTVDLNNVQYSNLVANSSTLSDLVLNFQYGFLSANFSGGASTLTGWDYNLVAASNFGAGTYDGFTGNIITSAAFGSASTWSGVAYNLLMGTFTSGDLSGLDHSLVLGDMGGTVMSGSYMVALGGAFGSSTLSGTALLYILGTGGGNTVSGNGNVLLGSSLGGMTLSGNDNFAMGNGGGYAATGNYNLRWGNIGSGSDAGNHNVWWGNSQSSSTVNSATYNFTSGYSPGVTFDGADYNTLLGNMSGITITSASSNTVVGSAGGLTIGALSQYNTLLGYTNSSTLTSNNSYNVIGGNFASATLLSAASFNVVLGTFFNDLGGDNNVLLGNNTSLSDATTDYENCVAIGRPTDLDFSGGQDSVSLGNTNVSATTGNFNFFFGARVDGTPASYDHNYYLNGDIGVTPDASDTAYFNTLSLRSQSTGNFVRFNATGLILGATVSLGFQALSGTVALTENLSGWLTGTLTADATVSGASLYGLTLENLTELTVAADSFNLVSAADEAVTQANTTTSTATTSTLQTISTATDTVYLITARIVAVRTGGVAGSPGDNAVYVRTARAVNIGGTLNLYDVQTDYTSETDTAWDATLDTSGTSVRVRVTGATNNNISWRTTTTIDRISF